MKTEELTFKGFNVKGTPKMRLRSVRHDLRVFKHGVKGKDPLSVGALQEFKWPQYWAMLNGVLPNRVHDQGWRSFPGKYQGPRSSQPVVWHKPTWTLRETRQRMIHEARAGISDDRFVTAVLLEHEKTNRRCWFWSTHFVVGGDWSHDPASRRSILATDLDVFWSFIGDLVRTGYPVLGEGDFNISGTSPAASEMRGTVGGKPVTYHGKRGVEYLFSIPGGRFHNIRVTDAYNVSTRHLATDHEGRCVKFHLVGE